VVTTAVAASRFGWVKVTCGAGRSTIASARTAAAPYSAEIPIFWFRVVVDIVY
jgi:hypothetical protein